MRTHQQISLAVLALAASCSTEGPAADPVEPAEPETSTPEAPLSDDPAVAAIQAHARQVRKASDRWRTQLPRPQKQTFTDGKTYTWHLQTSEGPIEIELMPAVAPMHVTSTIYLTELGFYDGLTFHRVIQNFMAQGGCPLGTGSGNPGYRFDGEFEPGVVHDRAGLLSTANAGPGTDGSQFFITFRPTPHLDGKHTIFGKVVAGMQTVERLEAFGSESGRTKKPLIIESAKITVEDA